MEKSDIVKFIAKQYITVVEAMQLIDNNTRGILFIVNDNGELIGSLSDGDIRRWIIKTGDLNGKAEKMMNKNPKMLFEHEKNNGYEFMKTKSINSVPIVDSTKKIVDILFDDEQASVGISSTGLAGTPIIIMAGGKGTRLYPYTKILPKPLIPIGDVPILERIINRFYNFGANDFYLTVNYKKEMIKSYFKELSPAYSISYIEESKPLGTAGSIKLIEKKFDTPVIITNCDILIEADYEKVLSFHKESGNALTIVSSLKNVTIPYGVLHSSQNGVISSMEEKPQLSYFINTGMYVLDPQYIEKIPDDTFYHMTHLADQLMSDGLQVGMYPISENSFLDMGEFEEMKKMEARINSGSVS
ncbi:MAG: nucleotidyltransferase family protein [Ruminococcus sp.]|uniref:nucleotidyltransferase family protein n=1 Tax=Ruminococcus sp. TaxID=41978 RepID=UPI001B1F6227|nr:nucleotidyltransferase family protein [Ruminococcus sp.]MBO7474076.1 nucleotidyltransferase family protein [Ruminococcus sp.]